MWTCDAMINPHFQCKCKRSLTLKSRNIIAEVESAVNCFHISAECSNPSPPGKSTSHNELFNMYGTATLVWVQIPVSGNLAPDGPNFFKTLCTPPKQSFLVWPILDDLVEMTSISSVGSVFVVHRLSNWSSNNHEFKKNYLRQTIFKIDKEFVRWTGIWKPQFSSYVEKQVVILVETMQSICNLEFCKFTQCFTEMRTYRPVKHFTTDLNMKFISLIWFSRSPPLVLVNVVVWVIFLTLFPLSKKAHLQLKLVRIEGSRDFAKLYRTSTSKEPE